MFPCISKFGKKSPALLCAGLFSIFLITACTSDDKKAESQPVIKVDEITYTAKDFAEELARRVQNLDALTVKESSLLSRVKENIVRDFIIEALSKRYAKKNEIIVKKDEIDNTIDAIRSHYPDDLAFRQALAEQGVSFKEWKDKVRTSLIQKSIMQELNKERGEPSLKELRSYYSKHKDEFERGDQVRLRQIVVESESIAKRIEKQLRNGKKMEDLAEDFSQAAEAERQGDIGWIEKGTLEVFDRAFRMRKGQRSPVLKSPYGYHIFKVLDKRKGKSLSFSEAKEDIRRRLLEKREQALYASWLEKQLRDVKVFKNEELIKAVQVETRGRE